MYPFFDKSDKKRIARTCNHIELETNNARKWSDFPENGIAIAADGGGNHLVLLPSEIDDSQLGEETYDWFHETGELIKVADSIIELLPKDEIPVVNRKFKTREKVNELVFADLEIKNIPAPWKLFRVGSQYEIQFGKNSHIKITLIECINKSNWTNEDYWKKQWEKLTELKLKSGTEVIYDKANQFDLVVVKTKGWIPVLIWIKPPEPKTWGFLFRTELNRFRGDMSELKNLLKKIDNKNAL